MLILNKYEILYLLLTHTQKIKNVKDGSAASFDMDKKILICLNKLKHVSINKMYMVNTKLK